MTPSRNQPLTHSLTDKPMLTAMKSEVLTVSEMSGVRGRSLQLAYSYLLSIDSIPPTSVEAECAFSQLGCSAARRDHVLETGQKALCSVS